MTDRLDVLSVMPERVVPGMSATLGNYRGTVDFDNCPEDVDPLTWGPILYVPHVSSSATYWPGVLACETAQLRAESFDLSGEFDPRDSDHMLSANLRDAAGNLSAVDVARWEDWVKRMTDYFGANVVCVSVSMQPDAASVQVHGYFTLADLLRDVDDDTARRAVCNGTGMFVASDQMMNFNGCDTLSADDGPERRKEMLSWAVDEYAAWLADEVFYSVVEAIPSDGESDFREFTPGSIGYDSLWDLYASMLSELDYFHRDDCAKARWLTAEAAWQASVPDVAVAAAAHARYEACRAELERLESATLVQEMLTCRF